MRGSPAVLLSITALMLLSQICDSLSGNALQAWGVIPRRLEALPGILLAPWIHGDWRHLASNLSALLVLAGLVLLRSRREFALASLFIILCSGILVWLFGRTGIHIGASGWLFGLWGLLLMRALFARSLLDLLFGGLVLILYGGWVFGFLPSRETSFEYHLAGALSGVLFAIIWRRFDR